jgi:hypothetical protein
LAEVPDVVAIKIAPFDRYATLEVVRAVADSGRTDIALYTGNDDAIVSDLVTPFPYVVGGTTVTRRIVGGLLGQWACDGRAASARSREEGRALRPPGLDHGSGRDHRCEWRHLRRQEPLCRVHSRHS